MCYPIFPFKNRIVYFVLLLQDFVRLDHFCLHNTVTASCGRLQKDIFVQKIVFLFVCLYLFWVCFYFPAISAFLGLPRLVMHPKQEIATLVLAAAWCCGFACICPFYVFVVVCLEPSLAS